MNLLGEYLNGNYKVSIFDNGTKIRETDDIYFKSAFPECMDIKITNYCDMNCPYCHEASSTEGLHGDILQAKFIDSLTPFTELAIGGGNPLSHPDLIPFLKKLKERKIIANMTVNQKHFIDNNPLIRWLTKQELIKGVGVSFTHYTDELFFMLHFFPNAVIHIINGVVNLEDFKKMYDEGFKVLILGYKEFRKGADFYSESVEIKNTQLYNELLEMINHFKVVSFDNLAIKQLKVQRLMSKDKWDEFYMGDDGQFTMYIDMVKQEFTRCSTSNIRYSVMDDVKDMFGVVKREIV